MLIHQINLLGDPGAATYCLLMQYKTGEGPVMSVLSLCWLQLSELNDC